jgi:hypothetical protein
MNICDSMTHSLSAATAIAWRLWDLNHLGIRTHIPCVLWLSERGRAYRLGPRMSLMWMGFHQFGLIVLKSLRCCALFDPVWCFHWH